jgi:protein arginine N-methyltransferase 1
MQCPSMAAERTGYTIHAYGQMVNNIPRMTAYAEALRRAITPGCTVFDIGAGPGVFALLACRFGAGKVVAIEPNSSISLLPQLARDNGCAGQIELFQGLSTDFQPSQRADVIVSDLRGSLPFFEHHVPAIVDARERLLKKEGTLLPQRDRLYACLVEAPQINRDYQSPWIENDLDLDLASVARFALNTPTTAHLEADHLLGDPVELGVIDYTLVAGPRFQAQIEIEAKRAGEAHGLLAWFDCEMLDELSFSNAPGQPEQIYGQTFFPLHRPLALSEGERIAIAVTADLVGDSYVWTWTVGSGPRQATFMSRILDPQAFEVRSSDHVPRPSLDIAIDQRCLAAFDGKRSLGAIADMIASEFPDRFGTGRTALDHVAKLAARYHDKALHRTDRQDRA